MFNFAQHTIVYITFAQKYAFFILAAMWQIVKFFLHEEWKGKYAVIGVLLYIFTAVLISYLTVQGMDKVQYASVFWIIVIFTTLQGIAKGFMQMRKGSFVFWHQMCSPWQFLAARMLVSTLLMMVFTAFTFLLFVSMHGSVDMSYSGFLLTTFLTGMGISSVFTISSSIAAKTDNPGVLLPVLTFPVILPVLLVGVKAGKKAVDDLGVGTLAGDIGVLLLFNLLIVVLGIILMKFIWKE